MSWIDRLREEIKCPLFYGRDGVLNAPIGGHDDHRDVWIKLFDGAEHTEPIAVGQPEVREHNHWTRPLKEAHGLRFIPCFDHSVPVAFKGKPKHRPERILIFDDQGLSRGRNGRRSQLVILRRSPSSSRNGAKPHVTGRNQA
jgi:hypothetical protein